MKQATIARLLRRLALALPLATLAGLSLATTYRFMTPVELLLAADVVFTASVVDVTGELRDGEVHTTVSFALEELFSGFGLGPDAEPDGAGDEDGSPPEGQEDPEQAGPPETLELVFLGGEAAGDRRLLVAGSPSWRTGETVLVAAYLDTGLASPLAGFRQGLWRLSGDAFVDDDGRPLGLDQNGSLVRSELPGAPAEVLAAVRALMAGEAPPPAPEPEAGPAVPPAGAPDAQPEEQPGDEPADEPGDEPSDEPGEEPGDEPAGEPGDEPGGEPVDDEPAGVDDAPPGGDAGADEPGPAGEPAAPATPVSATYRVEDSGGPLLLSDAVAAAAASWRRAGGDAVVLSQSADAENVIAYGEAELFSPETLSLTLVASVGPGGGDGFRALVSPAAGELLERALLHELGLMLGLPGGGPGVMALAVGDAALVPGEVELAELMAVNRFAPADLSRDGVVDFDDLLEFARAYGRTGLNLPGDIDGDGDVDDDDLALLREGYQLTPPRRPE